MKNALTALMLIAVFLTAFYLSGPRSRRPEHPQQLANGYTGPAEEGPGESSEDHPKFERSNWADPAAYVAAYEAIQKMPDERSAGKSSGKEVNYANFAAWECIGPETVAPLRTGEAYYEHGRIRCMHWYYNRTIGSWEPYLGASSGGLWYGQPFFGEKWTNLGDNLPNPSVGAFAIDPLDPNTIFVGTGDWARFNGAGLYRTTDRGASWQRMILGADMIPNAITQIFYLGGNVMLLSSDKGLFRSTDRGATWVLRWVEPTAPTAGIFSLAAATVASIYAAIPYHGIYRSNDGGDSWGKLVNGLPDASHKGSTLSIDASQTNTDVLYAAYTDSNNNVGGIYKTIDGGNTWTATASPPNYIHDGQGWHVNVIRVNPGNENIVYAAGVSFIRSGDGGSSWGEIGRGPARGHDDITTIEFDPADSNSMYLCGDGGIYQRDDGANTGHNDNHLFIPGAPIQEYSTDSPWGFATSILVSGTQDNGTIMTNEAADQGAPWWAIGDCDGGNVISINPKAPSYLFQNQWCGPSFPRLRTTNYGVSWDNIDQGLAEYWMTPIRFNHYGDEYLWTLDPHALFYSNDNGGSWKRADTKPYPEFVDAPPGSLTVNNYSYQTQKVAYVLPGDPTQTHYAVFAGTPGNMSTSVRTLPGTPKIASLIPDHWHADWVYALTLVKDTSQRQIFLSINRGANWTNITGNLPSGFDFNDIVSDPSYSKAFYLGTNMGMFKTIDGGAHWFTFQTGLPIVPAGNIVYIRRPHQDTIRIGTYGRGFWQRLVTNSNPILYAPRPLPGMWRDITIGPEHTLLASGDSGNVGRSTDNGQTWRAFRVSASNLRRIRLIDNQTGITVGDGGALLRSTDDGSSWLPIVGMTSENFADMSFTPGGNGWLITDAGHLFHTTNGGTGWALTADFSPETLHACFFRDTLHGWVQGTFVDPAGGPPVGRLHYTTDGGNSWNIAPFPVGAINQMQFVDDRTGFAVADSGGAFKSSDGGMTWSILGTGLATDFRGCFFADTTNGWICGTDGTFLKTENGGLDWPDAGFSGSSDLNAFAFMDGNLTIAGGGVIMSASQVGQSAVYYTTSPGWNIVSVPLHVQDSSAASLFPTAISQAFSYNGGYQISPTLNSQSGYWMRFSAPADSSITGNPSDPDTIVLQPGWNLIGSFPVDVATADLATTPPGIIVSQYFLYNGGYSVATALTPGQGYWVETNAGGTLYIAGANSPHSLRHQQLTSSAGLSSLVCTDAAGHRQTLRFGTATDDTHALPPLPPQGAFDIRFATGGSEVGLGADSLRRFPILLTGVTYPLAIRWDHGNNPAGGQLVVDGAMHELSGNGSIVLASAPARLELLLTHNAANRVPEAFRLYQNYPNPLNPSTRIQFSIPITQVVTIEVYNVLGQLVATLLNERRDPGTYTVDFDGSGLASGIYIYRIQTEKFSASRKMVLLR